MKPHLIIAIDGVGGAGKTTVAHQLALRLQANLLPSGLLYRFLAWKTLQRVSLDQALIEVPQLNFIINATGVSAYYQGRDIFENLMSNQVGAVASATIAQNAMVRDTLLPIQRSYAKEKILVCEGRDMASVVFPACDVAIFLTASIAVRNHRRGIVSHDENSELGARDLQDMNRKIAPLCIHPKSHIIDTSMATLAQVIDHIIDLIH
ncbi:MAG: hypothetical protein FJ186_02550 [Gammaproteobacteria bacterium]|nr:hypothetical protein [Gammaproteobacteria bacterium]